MAAAAASLPSSGLVLGEGANASLQKMIDKFEAEVLHGKPLMDNKKPSFALLAKLMKMTFIVSYNQGYRRIKAYKGVYGFASIFGGIFFDFHDNVQTGTEASLLVIWT